MNISSQQHLDVLHGNTEFRFFMALYYVGVTTSYRKKKSKFSVLGSVKVPGPMFEISHVEFVKFRISDILNLE